MLERETKWYYLGCRACHFGVDTKLKDYKDEESGMVKKNIIYICKNKPCGEDRAIDVVPKDFDDLLEKKLSFKVDVTDYNLSKNKFVNGISQICEEADATVSSSLTPSLGFIAPPSRLKYQDTGTSPIKRKLEDVIDVDELSNASSTKKKILDPKIEKD
ncbi:hypothetical protein Tco_1442330 [Tanacetum coccineum]